MKSLRILKISLVAFTAFVSITASAESANELKIIPKFDSCKSNIDATFTGLQDFSKSSDMSAIAKHASFFTKEGREIMRRMPTWRLMKSLGADPIAYSEKINSFNSCVEINKFFDQLEESVD